MYRGDLNLSDILDFKFTTLNSSTGAAAALAGGTISVYKNNSLTETTTGVTLTADFDSKTGLNNVRIDTSADGTFYAAGSNFQVVITAGTVGGVSAVGYVIAEFSIKNRVNTILDTAYAGHTTAGTVGGALNTSGSSTDPWSTAIPGAYGAGTAGKIVGDNVNAAVSSRASQTSVDALPTAAAIATAIWNSLTSALSVANTIGKLLVDNINATISSRLASASYTAPDNTSITSIKTKTDQLTFTTPNVVDASAAIIDKTGYSLSSAGIDAILDDAPSAELSVMPESTATLRHMIQYIFAYLRNRRTVTLTSEILYKENGTTALGSAPVSDDGTTTNKGKMV